MKSPTSVDSNRTMICTALPDGMSHLVSDCISFSVGVSSAGGSGSGSAPSAPSIGSGVGGFFACGYSGWINGVSTANLVAGAFASLSAGRVMTWNTSSGGM